MPRAAHRHAVSKGSTTAATTAATSNPVGSSSLGNPVESSSLDVVTVLMPKSIDWAFDIAGSFQISWTATEAVVVDVCCSTSSGDPGNPGGAGRDPSERALGDAVINDAVLVEDLVVAVVDVFVDDVDTIRDVVLVDARVVDRVLVPVDTVLDDVLVDAVVDDFVLVMLVDTFVDDVVVVMLMDAVVDVVQLEGEVLDCTQQVLLLCEGFCT